MAFAADKAAATKVNLKVPSLWGYTFKIVLALAIVLGIILLFAFLFKKIRQGSVPFSRKRKIEVMEIVPVMGKWAFAIVKVGKRNFLVGLSESSVTCVAELSDRDLEEETFGKVLEENL
ncbi:flagellar protein FliO/FliZ [Thermosulfidibacter takaii ABI70S6]|uniref:Flagellar protein FliO/FliZ n=1 Tax=Thermosulfidibacter takaii (strain DSM 17441 / JCM 13301 / NBRC 103674 / ABI70S6) TaxID=1298851 RepID=A0A0S3QSZ7_THET7|nr:flagellar biosynthetic protein FliO [Thermosulfidibacter takaii]BAT71449.1 flagellar protein FliO/FliZ [Thermosulfidibacter takaii ABI70S6]